MQNKFSFLLPAILLLGVLFAPPSQGATGDELEMKAAFLYNFAKFIEWPAHVLERSERLVVGVIGDASFQKVMRESVKGRTIRSKSIEVRQLGSPIEVEGCHMVFVADSEAKHLDQVLEAAAGLSILTIGEGDDFAIRGGVIQLYLENMRFRFLINQHAAQVAELRISAKLLSLATLVETGP